MIIWAVITGYIGLATYRRGIRLLAPPSSLPPASIFMRERAPVTEH